MPSPIIRLARTGEYDAVARVWMNSWVSTGLAEASPFLLAQLRARIALETENGWDLYVADDGGVPAAMLALHLPKKYLDMLFVAPEYIRGAAWGERCSRSHDSRCPTRSSCAACVKTKRHGAGTNVKVLCSNRKKSSP